MNWKVSRDKQLDEVDRLIYLESKLMEVQMIAELPYWVWDKYKICEARIEFTAMKKEIRKIKKELSID